MKLSNGAQRVLFGLVAGPAVLWLLWMGGWWRVGMFTFIVGGGMWEYLRILGGGYPEAGREPESILPALAAALAWISESGPLARFSGSRDLAIVLSVAWILLHGFRRLPRDRVFPWIAKAAVGLLYFGVWGSSLFALCQGSRGGWESMYALIYAVMSCWLGDTAAYLAGRALGRHKLCPELSPAKTVEGAIAAILVSAAFGAWAVPNYLGADLWVGLTLGVLLGVAAILGDLVESVFKRWGGVKDSSNLFPGHGGILDRADSLLLAAPLLQAVLRAWRH
jgi:phosphatidate cytidylyltransferase